MKHYIVLFYAWLVELWRKPLMWSSATIKLLFIPGINKIRCFSSKARAYAEFIKAQRDVPAYKKFLGAHQFTRPSFDGWVPNIHEIPMVDKENYIRKYCIDSRCVGGAIPNENIILDESSGSSGTATNWVRGPIERKRNAKMIEFGLKNILGNEPIFIINAFALGPWATGVNVTMSCAPFAKIKSLGPDIEKIANTIKQFGKKHKYVLMGYPPFLKSLIDSPKVDWHEHDMNFILGGESFSEGMRDYFYKKGIKKVYSSLGASDLELNISAENDFTISLRRLLRSNDALKARLLEHTGALPMIFQYNPTDFLIESSSSGELIITIARPDYVAPKIRYNIHDRGHTLSMENLYSILDELEIEHFALEKPQTDLPLLFHYGRSDASVSFFGSTITPSDIQEVIYSIPELSEIINSFNMYVSEDGEANKKLTVSLETKQWNEFSLINHEDLQEDFFNHLARINQDFREARKMLPDQDAVTVCFKEFGSGVFKQNDIRIKAKYIA